MPSEKEEPMLKRSLVAIAALLALSLTAGAARAADVKVCVEVVERIEELGGKGEAEKPVEPAPTTAPEPAVEATAPAPAPTGEAVLPPAPPTAGFPLAPQPKPRAPAEPLFTAKPARGPIPLWTSDTKLPIGQTSVVYMKRLFEHFVTHQPGYIAVDEKCDQRIMVELYPLREGWTAFARYSGTGREERVDQLFPSELSQYAERAVLALFEDVPISDTINRENVLRSDSQKSAQRVKGTNHFVLVLGTQLRGGMVDTAIEEGANVGQVESKFRVFSPLKAGLGYRGRFENWGLEAMAHVGIGTQSTSVDDNPAGGHIDLGGDAGMAVHFLHYFDPRGLSSLYLGAGATFELLWFRVIKDENNRPNDDTRSTLVTGGLDIDGVIGWEFMRASAVQFYLQAEINAPTYVAQTEDTSGSLHTWFPGVSLKLGVVF
jgi:hypothetical protein